MTTTLERVPAGTLVRKASQLANALVELCIAPFDPDTVKVYKAEMVKKHPPSWWYGKLWWTALTFGYAALPLTICLAIGTLLAIVGYEMELSNIEVFGDILALTALGVLAGLVLLEIAAYNIVVRGPAIWRSYILDQYIDLGRRLPDEAVKKVLALKHFAPQTRFFVEELEQKDVPLDPFLVAVDFETNERYFIHQWDEPLFRND